MARHPETRTALRGMNKEEIRALVGPEKFASTLETIRKISPAELMRFRIGWGDMKHRPLGKGDCAVAVVAERASRSLLSPSGYYHIQLDAAHQAGARTGLIYFGSEGSIPEIQKLMTDWNAVCVNVLISVPQTDFLLNGIMRVAVKLGMNALSTCTMVRLGRVMGNYMIWVVPSNLKLIDRATRYITKLTGLTYEAANALLFDIIEYVEPRMKSDQAYPPVVGMAVLRAKNNLTNEEAEARLLKP